MGSVINGHSVSVRNARATYFAAFFGELLFILPIWALYGTEQLGVSLTVATLLYITVSVVAGVLELPTGFLADRYGRKRIALVGAVLLCFYPLAFVVKLPVVAIFLVSAISAVGSALRSGPLLAVTHQSYRKAGRPTDEYNSFLSNKLLAEFVARIVSGAAGGALYVVLPELPYLALSLAYVAAVVSILFIRESRDELSSLSPTRHVKETLKAFSKAQIVVIALSIYIVSRLVSEAIFAGYQIFFTDDQLSPTVIGVIFGVIAAGSAASTYAIRHIMKYLTVFKIQLLTGLMVLTTAFLNWLPSTTAHIAAAIIMALSTGLVRVPIQSVIQQNTRPELHVTALSVFSLVTLIISGIGTIYVGVLLDQLAVSTVRTVLLAEAIVSIALITGLYIKFRDADAAAS